MPSQRPLLACNYQQLTLPRLSAKCVSCREDIGCRLLWLQPSWSIVQGFGQCLGNLDAGPKGARSFDRVGCCLCTTLREGTLKLKISQASDQRDSCAHLCSCCTACCTFAQRQSCIVLELASLWHIFAAPYKKTQTSVILTGGRQRQTNRPTDHRTEAHQEAHQCTKSV